MNPATSKVYQSLIKTCKYFFVKNRIIVISNAVWDDQKWTFYVNGRHQYVVDLTKLRSKLWITGRFCVYQDIANIQSAQSIVSTIILTLYQFDANEFSVRNQMISFNDYIYLASATENIYLSNVIVKDENDAIVSLEKLVKVAAKAAYFTL